jgi:excisionase family DNA binding protein
MSEQENASWMPDAPLLLSIFQVAALLGLCPKTIRNLIKANELVGRRVGSRLLVPRTSVESFVRKDHLTHKEK